MPLPQKGRFQKRQGNKSSSGNSYMKLRQQVYLGATAENIFLTANQIVYANNEVMMVNLRDA